MKWVIIIGLGSAVRNDNQALPLSQKKPVFRVTDTGRRPFPMQPSDFYCV